jgi:hypothetical protein
MLRENTTTYALEVVANDNSATTLDVTFNHSQVGGLARLCPNQIRVQGDNTGDVATIQKVLTVTSAFDPPNLVAGASTTTDITVNGSAIVNSDVSVSFSNAVTGIIIQGQVVSTGTVRVTFWNPTAGAINLAPGTLRVSVFVYTP